MDLTIDYSQGKYHFVWNARTTGAHTGVEEVEVLTCQSKLMNIDRCDADNTQSPCQRSVEYMPYVVKIALAEPVAFLAKVSKLPPI